MDRTITNTTDRENVTKLIDQTTEIHIYIFFFFDVETMIWHVQIDNKRTFGKFRNPYDSRTIDFLDYPTTRYVITFTCIVLKTTTIIIIHVYYDVRTTIVSNTFRPSDALFIIVRRVQRYRVCACARVHWKQTENDQMDDDDTLFPLSARQ